MGDSCKLNGRIGFRGYTEKDIVTKEIGGVLTFSPTNIVDNKLTMECKNTYITREKYDESPEIKIFNGDILFVKTGSTLGKSALVTGLKEDASINPQIVVMRVEKDKETFMSNVLITDGIKKQVTAVKIGGAVPTMTETELKNIKYYEPVEKEEQKRIGQYFEHLDHLITLHQRKCDETKQLKKFMLQKMFPKNGEKNPEIRFEGFTDAWEQRKLGELAEIVGGGTPSTSVNSYWDGDIDWYAPAEIGEQIYLESSQRKITEEGLNKSSAKILPIGTILFTSRAGIGKTAILLKEGCTNQGFQSIVPNKEKLDSYFIFTRSEELKRYGETVGAGSTFVEVSGKQMANMELMMPKTMPEQQQIGEYFANLDNLITLHQRKCEKLKALKKFMLQNMFI